MSDYEDDTCEGDRYDREKPCPQCKGKGWYVDWMLRKDCERCERTGVDLSAAGYYDNDPED